MFSHSSVDIVPDFGCSVKQTLVEKVRPGKPDTIRGLQPEFEAAV